MAVGSKRCAESCFVLVLCAQLDLMTTFEGIEDTEVLAVVEEVHDVFDTWYRWVLH